ncbi:DUF4006 family protein [Hydrogenimonas sp. SS33]|uniref:DUF4006 family protein n=1 Tax=Hydrogenimonas leucolamina TaxID=2954236 RepID=UPI00336BD5FD
MEKQGSAFGIHGITGMLIATVLLLSIVFGLGYAALVTQNETANQYYTIKDPLGIKMINPDLGNEPHIVVHGTPVGGDVNHKYQFVSK